MAIKDNLKTIDDVPPRLRAEVEKELNNETTRED